MLRRLPLLLLALACPAAAQGVGSTGEAEVPLTLRVNDAIARGVDHLLLAQGSNGMWLGDETRYPGGLTAFTCYALLKSGVRRKDRSIQKALSAIAEIEPKSVYGASARLLLYGSLGSDGPWQARAEQCTQFLIRTQKEGLWAYPWDRVDLSNVQFALLALWSADGMGIEIPDETLVRCARAVWKYRVEGQGFRYRDGAAQTGGMTAATLASVALLDRFGEERPKVAAALKSHRKSRISAHEFLTERWDPARNWYGKGHAWTPTFHYAYLWAVERYRDMTRERLLGTHDWYGEGAEWLIADQWGDGSWGEKTEDTCFALLFLRRSILSGGSTIAEITENAEAAAANRRKRAERPTLSGNAPWLTEWLVAGPYDGKEGKTGLWETPFAPDRVRVKSGARAGGKKWESRRLTDGNWTDLEVLTKRKGDHDVWALATRLSWTPENVVQGVEPKPLECAVWFYFEDGWRVFLNGEEISSGMRVQSAIKPDVRVPFELPPGESVLLVLCEDVLGAAAFGARLSGPNGKVLSDTLDVGLPGSKRGR